MAISCTPSDLLTASKCLCGIPSGKRELVMIYLLQQLAGLENLTAAQLLDRAKCLCGLSPLQTKAIEVALLCTATGGVPPCPPCPPSGGCTYQDMQVAWTPTNLKLGEGLGFFAYADIPGWTGTPVFSQATSLSGFDIEGQTGIVGISWPNLVSIDPLNTQGGFLSVTTSTNITSVGLPLLSIVATNLQISGCPLLASMALPSLVTVPGLRIKDNSTLTSISVPVYVPDDAGVIDFSGNNLSVATVDATLALCVASPTFLGHVDLSGGTNAAPSSIAPGSDYAILIGRGCTVLVNP